MGMGIRTPNCLHGHSTAVCLVILQEQKVSLGGPNALNFTDFEAQFRKFSYALSKRPWRGLTWGGGLCPGSTLKPSYKSLGFVSGYGSHHRGLSYCVAATSMQLLMVAKQSRQNCSKSSHVVRRTCQVVSISRGRINCPRQRCNVTLVSSSYNHIASHQMTDRQELLCPYRADCQWKTGREKNQHVYCSLHVLHNLHSHIHFSFTSNETDRHRGPKRGLVTERRH